MALPPPNWTSQHPPWINLWPRLSSGWTRLEPFTRETDLRASLEAGIADPLWLLGRQWQFGEFEADDGGSPVAARLHGAAAKLSRYSAGGPFAPPTDGAPYDPTQAPLEAVVEWEPPDTADGPSFRRAAEAGLQLLRMLEAKQAAGELRGDYRTAYTAEYSLTPQPDTPEWDPASRRFAAIMTGRVPDGLQLYDAVQTAGGTLPEQPAIQGRDRGAAAEVIGAWAAWFEERYGPPCGRLGETSSTWVGERLEYQFSVSARTTDGEATLTASEYTGGHLDWYAFDLAPGRALGAASDPIPEEIAQTVVPTPVAYRGMPSPRLWELEDARVNFAAVEAAPTDLGRLLLLEYALVSGGDQFLIPLDLDVGTLLELSALVVEDSFGVKTRVRSATASSDKPEEEWRMFDLSPTPSVSNSEARQDLLLLAPTLASSLEGEPVEDVAFLRDEMANLGWCVERVVEGSAGRPVRRHEAYLDHLRRVQAKSEQQQLEVAGPPLRYRLATSVPDHWIPLVPVKVANDTAGDPDAAGAAEAEAGGGNQPPPAAPRPDIRLEAGAVVGAGAKELSKPRGAILRRADGQPFWLPEEEVPRSGVRVARAYQLARWLNGSYHQWVGRRTGPAGGESSSGLRFDVVDDRRSKKQ